jgi:hypothetical protein
MQTHPGYASKPKKSGGVIIRLYHAYITFKKIKLKKKGGGMLFFIQIFFIELELQKFFKKNF